MVVVVNNSPRGSIGLAAAQVNQNRTQLSMWVEEGVYTVERNDFVAECDT